MHKCITALKKYCSISVLAEYHIPQSKQPNSASACLLKFVKQKDINKHDQQLSTYTEYIVAARIWNNLLPNVVT